MRTIPMDETNGRVGVNSSRLVTGLFWGAAAGATVALLFAPTSGRRLRRHLRASADRLTLRARDVYEDASETVQDLTARGRKAISARA